MKVRDKFFEDMATLMDYWTQKASESLTDESADLVWTDNPESFRNAQRAGQKGALARKDVEIALAECFRGLAVSFLTIIDGGTKLAEEARIQLIDEEGSSLGEGLHDAFVEHLLDTGRLE